MGMVHSGSTLLATILGSSSKAFLIPLETRVYGLDNKTGNTRFFVEKVNSIDSEFVIEKSPSHIFNINSLRKDFPKSKILITVRNPIDVVSSLHRRDNDFDGSLKQCIEYLDACENALTVKESFVVEYEEVIENFSSYVPEICSFVGMDFEEKMFNFYDHSPQWFEYAIKMNDDHLIRRAAQMKMPLFDGRKMFRELISNSQKEIIIEKCQDAYLKITGKKLA